MSKISLNTPMNSNKGSSQPSSMTYSATPKRSAIDEFTRDVTSLNTVVSRSIESYTINTVESLLEEYRDVMKACVSEYIQDIITNYVDRSIVRDANDSQTLHVPRQLTMTVPNELSSLLAKKLTDMSRSANLLSISIDLDAHLNNVHKTVSKYDIHTVVNITQYDKSWLNNFASCHMNKILIVTCLLLLCDYRSLLQHEYIASNTFICDALTAIFSLSFTRAVAIGLFVIEMCKPLIMIDIKALGHARAINSNFMKIKLNSIKKPSEAATQSDGSISEHDTIRSNLFSGEKAVEKAAVDNNDGSKSSSSYNGNKSKAALKPVARTKELGKGTNAGSPVTTASKQSLPADVISSPSEEASQGKDSPQIRRISNTTVESPMPVTPPVVPAASTIKAIQPVVSNFPDVTSASFASSIESELDAVVNLAYSRNSSGSKSKSPYNNDSSKSNVSTSSIKSSSHGSDNVLELSNFITATNSVNSSSVKQIYDQNGDVINSTMKSLRGTSQAVTPAYSPMYSPVVNPVSKSTSSSKSTASSPEKVSTKLPLAAAAVGTTSISTSVASSPNKKYSSYKRISVSNSYTDISVIDSYDETASDVSDPTKGGSQSSLSPARTSYKLNHLSITNISMFLQKQPVKVAMLGHFSEVSGMKLSIRKDVIQRVLLTVLTPVLRNKSSVAVAGLWSDSIKWLQSTSVDSIAIGPQWLDSVAEISKVMESLYEMEAFGGNDMKYALSECLRTVPEATDIVVLCDDHVSPFTPLLSSGRTFSVNNWRAFRLRFPKKRFHFIATTVTADRKELRQMAIDGGGIYAQV